MKKRFGVIVITAVFYLLMLLATAASKIHYRNSLAEVTIKAVETGFAKVDGVNTSVALVPEGMNPEKLFTVVKTEVNGTFRFLAKELPDVRVTCSEDGKNYLSGEEIGFGTVLVLEGAEKLCEGKEVKVRNEEDLPSWWE